MNSMEEEKRIEVQTKDKIRVARELREACLDAFLILQHTGEKGTADKLEKALLHAEEISL